MKSTNVGVNLNQTSNFKFFTKDYVQSKYDGTERRVQRVVLHHHFQHHMQQGTKHVGSH
jgi:hypothetical protein